MRLPGNVTRRDTRGDSRGDETKALEEIRKDMLTRWARKNPLLFLELYGGGFERSQYGADKATDRDLAPRDHTRTRLLGY